LAVVKKIEEHLAESIASGAIGYGEKLPSRSHLAAQFRVSPTTVSRAIQRISQEYNLKFVPGKGVFLQAESERQPLTIGLIGAGVSCYATGIQLDDNYFGPIMNSLRKYAEENDFALLAIPGIKKEPIDIDRIASYGANCIVSCGGQLSEQTVLDFRKRGIPLLGNPPHSDFMLPGTSFVAYDNIHLFRDAVHQFHKQGHQRIACVVAHTSNDKRRSEWCDTFMLEAVKLGMKGTYEDTIRTQASENLNNNAEMEDFFAHETRILLDLPKPPTAIFYHMYTNLLQPALAVIADHGLELGKEFSVIGLKAEGKENNSAIAVYIPQADLFGQTVIEIAGKMINDPHAIFQINIPFIYIDN
jgi:DNA-binding LacI/PurR family transcriptional regulator